MPGLPGAPGPVQLLVIAFANGKFDGRVLEELRRLREHDVVGLLDLLFVVKDDDGEVFELELSDLSAEESAECGALVRALFGSTGEDEGTAGRPRPTAATVAQNGSLLDLSEAWFLADVIPAGTAAAVVLLEHRWAIPLRDAVEAAEGHDLVDTWVHPRDLAGRD
ncbi:MAG TPA: hypothetical protein VJ204_19345 [Solirubrobacterales bacterium]|nr:hypothetical protein [Solirubrobacterales bacterium]